MVKLFRKFRQRFLSENKFRKYIIYAIGEIILVVIGILIALQLNKSNDFKNDRTVEIKLLQNFTNDLNADINDLNYNINYNNWLIKTLDSIVIGLNEPKNYNIKDFVRHNSTFGYHGFFAITDGTFVESTGAGKMSLIQSNTIRKQLFNYYRYPKEGVDEVSDQILNIHINPNWFKSLSATKEFAKASGMLNTNLPAIDLYKVSKDMGFMGSINIKSGMCYGQIRQWEDRKEKINNLIQLIGQELEQLNK